MSEKVNNRLLYGYIDVMALSLAIAVVFTLVDIGVVIIAAGLFVIDLLLLLTSPRCYVFSEEKVEIKYFFGLKETIEWRNIRSVSISWSRGLGRYHIIDEYEFCYFADPNEKHLFFMKSKIHKTRKTENLMKKYCPKKVD